MTARSGLFRGPATTGGTARDAQKQAVFAQFKAICVPLLQAARSATFAESIRTSIDLLGKLTELLRTTTGDAFTPALANYAFFPLSSLLRPPLDGRDRGDRVLEATMQALAVLVDKWRAVGMDARVRQELWIMTALTLGGPLDPRGPGKSGAAARGKGKAVERTEEADLAMVVALLALMRPHERREQPARDEVDDDPLGERIDWSRIDATDPSSFAAGSQRQVRDPPPPVPILFHTLTTLLALATEPTSLLQLQLSSLEALRILVADYLAQPSTTTAVPASAEGPSPLLATALPGTASTLSRIALSMPSSSNTEYGKSTRRQASSVIAAALQTLSLLIVETVGDGVTAALREASDMGADWNMRITTLEELVGAKLDELAFEEPGGGEPDEVPRPPPDEPPTSAPPPTGPVVPTPSWLRFTLTSLATLFAALSPLSTHDSPTVRTALVALLSHVLARCARTLGDQAEVLLEGLLALASDDWDTVRSPARSALLATFAQPPEDAGAAQHPLALAARIVQRRLAALPGALRRQDEHAVRRGAGIVRSALELLPAVTPGRSAAPLQGVEKWSWALLGALEVERVSAAGRAAEGGMALAWITGSSDSPASSGSAIEATAYPPVRLRGITEQATVVALEALWEALGSASAVAEQDGEVVDQFLGVALGPRRNDPAAVSALWALDGVLRGLRTDAQPSTAQKKVLKLTARAVLALMEDLEQASAEDEPSQPSPTVEEPRRDVLAVDENEPLAVIRLIEHKKGVTNMPSLDAYNPVAALSTTREMRASHLLLLSAFSLRLLATVAAHLSSSFQPFLMQSLYHVLAHLSPTTHPFLRAHAQHALALISESTSYASPQNLVLANVDYVVNSVSQRLSVARLEPNAPLVLVEMIRLVGRPIVPMVQDLVDDVFEALDDYHGYEEVTVGLWAVLDALLKVMVEDLPAPMEDAAASAATTDIPRPDADDDWRALEVWLARRRDGPPTAEDAAAADDLPEANPQKPFVTTHDKPGESDPQTADPTFTSDAVAPPTRPQRVTAQILHKALYFLSHPSAFLRARVLSLLASAVPLLTLPSLSASPGDPSTTREADLLPVVHRAWPLVLLRLAPPPREDPTVALEAVALVGALARYTGGFMSRRVAEDVWPRFAALLSTQSSGDKARGLGRWSAEHKLHAAVLRATRDVARAVPLKEAHVWDAARLVLVGFLARSSEPELRALAAEVLCALGAQNADAVWVVVRGTVGGEGAEGLPRWLRVGWEGTEWGDEVQGVLAGL